MNPLAPVKCRILKARERSMRVWKQRWYIDSIEVLAKNAIDGHHIWSRRADGSWHRAVAVQRRSIDPALPKFWVGEDWTSQLPESSVPEEVRELAFLEWQRRQPVEKPQPSPAERKAKATVKRGEKLQADLTRWRRKLKLAQTKVKKATARLKRWERSQKGAAT